MKIVKNNKVEFVSAELSTCLLGSVFEYSSSVFWSWCNAVSEAVHIGPLTTWWKLQRIHNLWLPPPSLAMHGRGQLALQSRLLTAQVSEWVNKQPKASQDLPLPAGLLSVLVTEPTISERASGGLRQMGPPGSPLGRSCHSDFRKDVPLPQNHTSESVPGYFP